MNANVRQLLEQAQQLSAAERDELIAELLAFSEPVDEAQIAAEWDEEIRRRVAEIEAGEVQCVSWEEVRRRFAEADHDASN